MKPALVTSLPPEVANTRRMHERVLHYWQDLKSARRYPMRQEVDLHVLGEMWDWCFIIDIRRGEVSKGFRYDHMGHALNGAYGMNMMSIERCDDKTQPHIASMLLRFDEVAESGEPTMDESTFRNAEGNQIKYRCCLLPLGRERVEYILGCMRWKLC